MAVVDDRQRRGSPIDRHIAEHGGNAIFEVNRRLFTATGAQGKIIRQPRPVIGTDVALVAPVHVAGRMANPNLRYGDSGGSAQLF